ncbi:hypothetical protein M9458_000213, partial [Cirrhinus mrigala]
LWNPCHLTRKAELLLDPSTVLLKNVTVVKEVLSSILRNPRDVLVEALEGGGTGIAICR